ncbi:MAG: hypothetical protein JW941_10955, partial [Candidatus Coatesbacteria bacterium]|nr:hypothetical protein [Candidatus Coatesbacteria bacterium]
MHRRNDLLIWAIVVVSVVYSATFSAAGATRESMLIPFSFTQPALNHMDGVDRISVSGCDERVHTYQCPALPYRKINLTLPLSADDISVELTQSEV